MVLGACERNSSGVDVLRSYRRPAATEPVSLVDVCQITMANSRHRGAFDARVETQIPLEHMIGTINNMDYARLLADEVRVLYNCTGRLKCLLEIGSESTKDLGDSEHFQIGNLKELAGYVTGKSMAEAEAYCSAQGLYDTLESCARVLVESRLSRARTIGWEIFAFSDRYMCSVCREEGSEVAILDKPAFFDHVSFVHDFYDREPPEMFKIQEQSRFEL